MGEYNNDVFEFGVKQDENTDNFNYENISGLGESNYENEDLFDNVPSNNVTEPVQEPVQNDFNINNYDYNLNNDPSLNNFNDIPSIETQNIDVQMPEIVNNNPSSLVDIFGAEPVKINEDVAVDTPILENIPVVEKIEDNTTISDTPAPENNPVVENITEPAIEQDTFDESMFEEMPKQEEIKEEPVVEEAQPIENEIPSIETPTTLADVTEDSDVFYNNEDKKEEPVADINNIYSTTDDTPNIPMSDTPIDELEKLTEYEEEKIDTTDINSLFEKLSVNVKDASDIFKKNTTLKQKIDSRFEELKKLQGELTNSRKKQMEEIDQYREEVLNKLTEKKEEIEKRLNTLKELQATLEKEKTEFEEYKRTEQANINKIQKQVQVAYDERREELEHIESVLRKQKDSLDEERNQLSLDKIQYEADKNDLANSLLKFNQIVDSFTNGIDMKEE